MTTSINVHTEVATLIDTVNLWTVEAFSRLPEQSTHVAAVVVRFPANLKLGSFAMATPAIM